MVGMTGFSFPLRYVSSVRLASEALPQHRSISSPPLNLIRIDALNLFRLNTQIFRSLSLISMIQDLHEFRDSSVEPDLLMIPLFKR